MARLLSTKWFLRPDGEYDTIAVVRTEAGRRAVIPTGRTGTERTLEQALEQHNEVFPVPDLRKMEGRT